MTVPQSCSLCNTMHDRLITDDMCVWCLFVVKMCCTPWIMRVMSQCLVQRQRTPLQRWPRGVPLKILVRNHTAKFHNFNPTLASPLPSSPLLSPSFPSPLPSSSGHYTCLALYEMAMDEVGYSPNNPDTMPDMSLLTLCVTTQTLCLICLS